MNEIKLNKRYKYSGDIFRKLIGIGFDIETATDFLNEVADADVEETKDCEKCIYVDKHVTEYPCSHCRNCYTDKFQPNDATEQAYKNGYEKGFKDCLEYLGLLTENSSALSIIINGMREDK